ncbi:hypothetical protein A3C09_04040 [Candidatus Uhrbacteria bacterium RIFCSPHIGHO2_02_FULL_47_44]|uniref:DUF5667 domain-containing protein n=1 Tax=Candidatus Uhrbacteria bacterium RIFCSPLOWO2_02_FULL_48_18 TaxID=1802408 RepID=A0A1F7V801_9BACT|nr:MAG: hypothetical protein A2839_01565 [Candidatus Uhrbacteria bacterium RIFCSPHIGHO2_01_FULL_47_10]OGL71079.1 MAG: hypothetical protein A3C09_04040 [Candidatus Uhrbacteria bacterium RIFCSPHIGHO2_02_FULL_47_44]OGL80812.1 MAG: hypothetical protein A3B20_05530 [Candidatus Uhrbacteria bacterium RIFCSPLOWO2_01_FULL_47_17]OGL86535.1 MAG: hypothetical protein A3I41_04575 [Candidatus Uhrbacteria bacterium RIFCSPLOWO2_02_FULL_48_18]OGL92823.1 MAG: hypothetical protein A3H12_02895 [Candidatus Uhrbacte
MRKYDFDPELEKLLISLKDHQALGGNFDFKKSWSDVADKCGFDADTSGLTHTWRDWLEFYIWDFTHVMLKPVGAFAFFILFFVGGWLGIANASLGTLPGEQLYKVKLGMERVQMALATSGAQKAQLRMEFTSRRLEEMVALAASGKPSDISQIAMAVDRVKQDVTDIKSDLTTETASQATELAKAVGRKADVYTSTVTSSASTLPSNVQTQVDEVKTIISETKEQAVEVIITAHEQSVTADNTRELELTFQKAFAHASLIATKEEQPKLAVATALQKKGIYRRAFQVLKEIEMAHVATE